MTIHRLDPIQLRVLGCLIEKQRTTPEQYPLTLNALRLACNQATNREPVLELDELEVRAAAQSLGTLGWARLATGPGSRTAKYRQLFGEALDFPSLVGDLIPPGERPVQPLETEDPADHDLVAMHEHRPHAGRCQCPGSCEDSMLVRDMRVAADPRRRLVFLHRGACGVELLDGDVMGVLLDAGDESLEGF